MTVVMPVPLPEDQLTGSLAGLPRKCRDPGLQLLLAAIPACNCCSIAAV